MPVYLKERCSTHVSNWKYKRRMERGNDYKESKEELCFCWSNNPQRQFTFTINLQNFPKCPVNCMLPKVVRSKTQFWQWAYIKNWDCQELIIIMKTTIDDFKHVNISFYIIFLDFRDAFGSNKGDVANVNRKNKGMNYALDPTNVPSYTNISQETNATCNYNSLGKNQSIMLA